MSKYPEDTFRKFVILTCGPLMNIFLAVVSGIILKSTFSLNAYIFMTVNIFLFVFNILPVYFLDGGQILNLFIKNKTIGKILDTVSFVVIFVVSLIFSIDIKYSIIAITIFIIYYLINQKSFI